MRVLITDLMFPNRFSSWRNNSILSFMDKYDTSILVKNIKNYAGIDFSVDWESKEFSVELEEYNILIFDPQFNYLNKYNKRLDGTEFNSLSSYSYLITKDTHYDIDSFDHYFHIFLNSFEYFNNAFEINHKQQSIHLYPGGGYNPGQILNVPKEVNIISTFPLTTSSLHAQGFYNVVECLTSVQYRNESVFPPKPESKLASKPINCVYASLGNGREKGEKTFRKIVFFYKIMHPTDKVNFLSIGKCGRIPFVRNLDAMSWMELEKFYGNEIDIYLNTATGVSSNGWPLGLEAIKLGSVLLTTDVDGVSGYYRSGDYGITICRDWKDFVKGIRSFYLDRVKLRIFSRLNQKFAENFASFDKQQKLIFESIQSEE